jgi:hypothetical protein
MTDQDDFAARLTHQFMYTVLMHTLDSRMPFGGSVDCHAKAEFQFRCGVANFSRRDLEPALRCFDQAERLGYDADRCAAYRWDCWMLLGEFENAWRESDRIAARGASGPHALWDGSPFTGKRVVIRCLHGFGDAIQFLRYARLVRQQAARVIVETHPEMVSILSRLPFVDHVTSWADSSLTRDDWDQQIEVTELPRAFRTTLATIPADIPYLDVSARCPAESGKPKVGLLWASSQWNPARSMRLAELVPLLELDGFSFYSFQRSQERGELTAIQSRFKIHDTADHSPDILDTAVDLMSMDLLITVDTMAAHLAGALGRNVWTLLPWEADWRWMVGMDDSPWYPTMRLFRQTAGADWGPVVDRVACELLQWFSGCINNRRAK